MSKPLDPASPDPVKNGAGTPTLEEFAEELRRRFGPDCPVTVKYPEPPKDGTIKTKFFFINRGRHALDNDEERAE